ncbi:peptidoglycan DD-metalloendopeptidase family protein [Shewanella schlegeliana]|uniref:Peptidoglycan DD-metalloendopeptidase family protein n=1 Tax=Shewanella schlegeliana TaxID=190308 RepID=A0ABS1T066_9GAMM|nr:peptidoglycan DD-metalloendopeptidase family protein [Shewanella schlegeliana]MBL4914167.1 peptidoglycan DD-metalloendopeptidase family protein [Shewanella schlegeliana]MCL1111439.1 peptidoglycan DD-metalloendopeptidase family protein [Shewanella schlegeliana]
MRLVCLYCVCALLLLSGCSFQSDRPAPVESINGPQTPSISKGSIRGSRYIVKTGDTLYSIAWGANKDFVDLAKQNRLPKPYTIYPGQVLSLSSKKSVTNSQSVKKTTNSTVKTASVTNKATNKQPVSSKPTVKNSQTDGSKKQLDPATKPAYSVTSSQQDVNQVVHKPAELPTKVSRWSWPVKGKVIGTFSAKEQGNKGIKIAGNRGDAIKAAASGRVVYAGSALRGYGNLVIIKHSDDYLSAYAHADKILVKEKQTVNVGQTVATMGSTGTNRIMLHFEIRYHGKSVNPLKFLPKQ